MSIQTQKKLSRHRAGKDGARQLKVGLVGAGRVGQAAHLHYLCQDADRFDVRAVADPSPTVRAAVGERYGVTELHAGIDGVLELGLDAIVCAARAPYHAEIVVQALEAGCHVLCEKPLALTLRECDEMIAAGDRTGLVAQVGYMKRYDPAFERLVSLLPPLEEIRYVSAEVVDGGSEPFLAHVPIAAALDVAETSERELAERTKALVEEQVGLLPADAFHAYIHGFLGSIVHDVNLVHGILEALDAPVPARLLGGRFWAGGTAVEVTSALPGGALFKAVHVSLPGVNDYREQLTILCSDRVFQLTFPSPYLLHAPAILTVSASEGESGLSSQAVRVSYEDAFRSQLRAFHDAVVSGAEVRTSLREARADVELVVGAAVASLDQPPAQSDSA